MKYQLTPVEAGFIVRTTNLEFQASEQAPLSVTLEVETPTGTQSRSQEAEAAIRTAEITFPLLAKLDYTMLNFWEANHKDFAISGSPPDNRGFYRVTNSGWDLTTFDPLKRFNLAHFLIVGYDSYLEVLASADFEVQFR